MAALKNYTTDVPVIKTVNEIHLLLAQAGAKKIMFDYADDGELCGIMFSILTPNGERGVKLPSNADRVREVLRQQKQDPKNRNRSAIDDSKEQAERVAWRIVKDWTSAQLAILQTRMVDIEQVFLPYFCNNRGQTIYELYQNNQLMLE